jgi:hypothetical protein
VVHAWNPNKQEDEAGESLQTQDQPGLHISSQSYKLDMSLRKKKKKKGKKKVKKYSLIKE